MERGKESFSKMRAAAGKGGCHCGTQQWLRNLVHLTDKKRLIALLFLLTDYVPGDLFTSPLIFEMILPGRNNCPSFADEKTEYHISLTPHSTETALLA